MQSAAARASPVIRVLGRIEVRSGPERSWVRPPPQQRMVLALLVARLGRPCAADRLSDALWGNSPPRNARRLLQGLVSQLRRSLVASGGSGPALRVAGEGWQLDADPDAVDATRLERLAAAGAARLDEGDRTGARVALEEAVALTHGRAFAELSDHPALVADAARLEEQRLTVRERLLELRLAAGEHAAAVVDLRELVAVHPLREQLWGLWMQALYRSGRQAEALRAYEELRERLEAELGADPGPELERLHIAVLRHEPPAAPATSPRGGSVPPRGDAATIAWPCRRDLPLVGRDKELAVLGDALAQARGGQRRLMLVSGEPGSGKSRLAAELATTAQQEGTAVLAGWCSEGAAAPYRPFVEALRADVEATPDAQLEARLGRHVGELARLVPEVGERTGRWPSPGSTNPDLDQHRLFEAVRGWLEAAAAAAPLLLVVEDLHAATRPTLLLLRHLAQAPVDVPLLVVATYRDTAEEATPELVDALAALARRPEVDHVVLAGLPRAAVELLVTRSLDAEGAAGRGLAAELHRTTGGNPLFVQELLAGLRSGSMPEVLGLEEAAALPWSLRNLLDARLQRLPQTTVRLLEQAAVAGERFDFGVVAEAVGLADDTALEALEHAAGARLVAAMGVRDDRYAFTHALVRGALLSRLTPSRRMRLHARLAGVLERRHPDAPVAVMADLAHHLAQAGAAGDPAKARRCATAAGDAALAQLAYEEAAAHYDQALRLLDGADDAERCDALIRLGHAQQRAGTGVHSKTLQDALVLATRRGDPERIARAAWVGNRGFPRHLFSVDTERVTVLEGAAAVVGNDAPGPRATLLAVLAGELTFAVDRARPRQLSDEALALARRADDTVLARVLTLRQFTIHDPTTVTERLADTGELVPLTDRLADPSLQLFARWWRAIAGLQAGERAAVDASIDEACQLADELGEPFMGCASLMLAATRAVAWGALEEVSALGERYRELAARADAYHALDPYTWQQLWVHRERGDLAETLPAIEELRADFSHLPHSRALLAPAWWEVGRREEARAVLDEFTARGLEHVPVDMMWLCVMCSLAEVAAASGDAAAARGLHAHLSPFAGQMVADAGLFLGAVTHYLGLLATAFEDFDLGARHLDEAVHAHAQLRARRWTNRSRLAHVRLLLARDAPGDTERVDALLRETATAARQEGQGGVARGCAALAAER